MQTSRFQLGLIATLAVGLGFSLASSDAVGYPAGAAVSLGSNPIWNNSGILSGSWEKSAVLVAAPISQDAIVTDLYLSTNYSTQRVVLVLGDGTEVGRYLVRNGAGGNINHRMETGIRVPAGDTLTLQWDSSYDIHYNAHGYYAQP